MTEHSEIHLAALPRQLADGLVLRLATPVDGDRIAGLCDDVFGHSVGVDARKFLSGDCPTGPADWVVVEDTEKQRVISAVCLIPLIWAYRGIKFGVGRPELVATHPDYRRRGLMRRQFKVIDEIAAARDQHMLAITGIPFLYRQFGYEMALNLEGGRTMTLQGRPESPRDSPMKLRPARDGKDCAFIRRLCEDALKKKVYAGVRSGREWEWELGAISRGSCSGATFCWSIIQQGGRPMGFIQHSQAECGCVSVYRLELSLDIGLPVAPPSLLPWIADYVRLTCQQKPTDTVEIRMLLGRESSLYASHDGTEVSVIREHSWWIRIPNLASFLQHIRKGLELNLADSAAAEFTGTLNVSLFRDGIRFKVDSGRLKEISAMRPWGLPEDRIDARFPELTFLQLIGGRRRIEELHHVYPDCSATPEACAVLEGMFPEFSGTI